jgi:hypothetical protein
MEKEIDEKSAEHSNKAPMHVPPPSDTLNSGLRHDTATAVAEQRDNGHGNTFDQVGRKAAKGEQRGKEEEQKTASSIACWR